MLYTKEYNGTTEELELDFNITLMGMILLKEYDWTNKVTIPLYVYDHRNEYVEEILAVLSEKEQKRLKDGYENDTVDCDDIIHKLTTEDHAYLLTHGAHENFPIKFTLFEERNQDSAERDLLKKQLVKEAEEYIAGENREFVYLTKVLERRPECMQNQIGLDKELGAFDLSPRAFNCLHRAGYETIGDIMELSEEDLYGIRNLSKKPVREILDLQDAVRSRIFGNDEENVFELSLSAELIMRLLEHGYFFWSDIKNEFSDIDALLAESGLEKYRKPLRELAREKVIDEINGDENVTLIFDIDLV